MSCNENKRTDSEELIWCWDARAAASNSYVEFECTAEDLCDGELVVSATTSFRVMGEDRVLLWGPPREVPPYAYVDRVDLATLPLRPGGGRAVRILAHHLGVNTHTHVAGPAALLVGGVARRADGSVVDLSDLRHWWARPVTAYRFDAPRLGMCIGFSEHYAFGVEAMDWAPPVAVARHPWDHLPALLERDLPEFGFQDKAARDVVPFGGGWLVDFGEEVFGFLEVEFSCAGKVDFEMTYAEVLDAGRVDPHRHPAVNARDRIEAPAGRHRWQSYEKRALRYVQFSFPVEIHGLRVIESQWPLEPVYRDAGYDQRTATDEGRKLNRILDISARTIELNIEDIITDCPWRERAQYFDIYFWEDALLQLFGTDEPVRRFLKQYARGADPATGRLRMCYPSPPASSSIVDFSLSYPVHLENFGRRTGDWEFVRKLLPLAEAGVLGWREFDREDLLVDPKGWVFLDNTNEMPRAPRSAALNAVYAGSHATLASIHEHLGSADRAAEMRAKAAAVRSAFRATFLVNNRLLDADSVPALEAKTYWNYHYPADRTPWVGKAEGSSFVLRVSVCADCDTELNFMPPAGLRVWLDGDCRINRPDGPGWARPVLGETNPLRLKGGRWHTLTVQVEFFWADWEFWLSSDGPVEISEGVCWTCPWKGGGPGEPPVGADSFATRLRPWAWPRHNQITAGYAAFFGMLDPEEARRELAACLPATYDTPWRKRVTPFFSTVTEDRTQIESRVLPCHVPSSLFYFSRALVRYGMTEHAQRFVRMIYDGMIERGATTWWEEWESNSSNCHAWACTGVPLLFGIEPGNSLQSKKQS